MAAKPIVAVILSGSGVYDGSEIHEAVMTLLAIDRRGAEARCFAPDIAQSDVVDHATGKPVAETRSVLAESARIARGAIAPLSAFKAEEIDALVFPGGFGAAKNLSSFAKDGPACAVEPSVAAAIEATHRAGKPIGALCIAPTLLARILPGVELTIGTDAETAAALVAMGARHTPAGHGKAVVDKANRVATAPAYMLEASLADIAADADAVIAALLAQTREKTPA